MQMKIKSITNSITNYDKLLSSVKHNVPFIVCRKPEYNPYRTKLATDYYKRDRICKWATRNGIPYRLEIKRLGYWLVACWTYIPKTDPIEEAEHYADKIAFDRNLKRFLRDKKVTDGNGGRIC